MSNDKWGNNDARLLADVYFCLMLIGLNFATFVEWLMVDFWSIFVFVFCLVDIFMLVGILFGVDLAIYGCDLYEQGLKHGFIFV